MKSKKTAAAWMRKGPPRKIKTTLGDRVFHAVNNTVMILLGQLDTFFGLGMF